MSAVDYIDYQRAVRLLEDDRSRLLGQPVKVVRAAVAREIGVPPGTLEDIRRGRLKALQGRVERAIDAALIRFINKQFEGLTHELAIATARAQRGSGRVVAQATAARDALDGLIEDIGEGRS